MPLYFDGFFYPFNSLLDVLDTAAQELQTHATAQKAKEQPAMYKPMPVEKVIAFIKASVNPAAIFLLHMLQQGAEIIIRGLVTALSGSCVKTHYFNVLKKPLKRYLPALDSIISKNEVEEERLLHLLEKAYLESRYSSGFTVSDADIDVLAEAVEGLHEKADALFKQRISSINCIM